MALTLDLFVRKRLTYQDLNNKIQIPIQNYINQKCVIQDEVSVDIAANKIVRRDAQGRVKFGAPEEPEHGARKAEVDAHEGKTSTHGATAAATPNRIMMRDSAGRASVADPTSASHIATKGYVDGLVGPLEAGTAFAYYLTPPNVELSSTTTFYEDWWIWNITKSMAARILLPGTIRYHVQYRSSGSSGTTYVRILLNGSQIREVSTSSTSWQTATGNITVNPGDYVAIQQRTSNSSYSAYWRNVRIETAQPSLGIQRF